MLGAGLSGTAAALLLASEGAKVTVLDSADRKKLAEIDDRKSARAWMYACICGPDGGEDSRLLRSCCPESRHRSGLAAGARIFRRERSRSIGELELGWRSVSVPVIAITGTNGKTTTTELVAQMLNACGQRTIACGNIGKPLSEVAREQATFDVLTVEVSSFQLETIRTFPAVDQRLAEFRARSSRSLSPRSRNIARPSCASLKIKRRMTSRS